MSTQTIVAAAEPPDRQPVLSGVVKSRTARRPDGVRWRHNPLTRDCGRCVAALRQAIAADVAWAELPPKEPARLTRDTVENGEVVGSEHFCYPHAYETGYTDSSRSARK